MTERSHREEVIGVQLSVLLIWVLAVGLTFTSRLAQDGLMLSKTMDVEGDKDMLDVAVFGLAVRWYRWRFSTLGKAMATATVLSWPQSQS
ncbi:hypothetical protein L914_19880 [Phytophthora nicotianae]|uniref:Uncharacterized protein n=1 Tax=Phytophthora nicotianae TaxID=4792 RepID=W2MBA0_PHYNI|nr:hypothetical protein L914_19880 [Phytophthora nicotianae]